MSQLSFRDPDGFVFSYGGRILRCVHPNAIQDLGAFLSSTIARKWTAEGTLPSTDVLTEAQRADLPSEILSKVPDGAMVLEHQPIRFSSYPYEWPPIMLLASAALTLSLAQASATAAFGLKDATPYNIMFEGPKPVFIDLLSFERRDSLNPVWRPYAQFVRAFLYPLFVSSYFGIRLEEILLPHRDGLEPERMLRICPLWRLLLPPFLGTVTIPAILSRGENARASDRSRARKSRNSQEAKFLLDQLFGRAGRLLVKALDRAPKKHSSYYADSGNSYTARELAER